MKKSRRTLTVRSVAAIGLSIVVLTVIIVAITLLDSPAEERLHRLDERRVSDLRELAYAVDAYWTREGALPASLEELSNEERIVRELADPETGDAYEYRVLGDNSYELCAVFVSEMDAKGRDVPYEYFWFHGIGRQCFSLTPQDINRVIERY